jgi:glycerophosphoryl diester phosphodiesterase
MIWETLGRIGARGLNSQADDVVLGTELVGRLKRAGYEVATWTVDDPSLAARLIEAGVEMITTNRPRWMREKCLQSAKQPGL